MVKPSRDVHNRARKVSKEMLFFWKRNEKEERDLRKKAEKEAIEKLRIEEEMREARRQARKLNFLITQTELYSHFIGKKIGSKYPLIMAVVIVCDAEHFLQCFPFQHL
jgi:DNA helicase INO80